MTLEKLDSLNPKDRWHKQMNTVLPFKWKQKKNAYDKISLNNTSYINKVIQVMNLGPGEQFMLYLEKSISKDNSGTVRLKTG